MTKGYAGLTLQTSSLTHYGKSAKPLLPGTGYILVPDPTLCPPARNVPTGRGNCSSSRSK